jgi:hypothetical protein
MVLPSLLIAGLVGLDYFLVERIFPLGVSHLVTIVIGVAGVLAFSTAVFNQLAALQSRDRANTQRLRALADELEEKRKQLQASPTRRVWSRARGTPPSASSTTRASSRRSRRRASRRRSACASDRSRAVAGSSGICNRSAGRCGSGICTRTRPPWDSRRTIHR